MSSSENSSSNPFKDRFENWEGPVRPDFWNDLEKNLDASSKKQVLWWWWIGGLTLLGCTGFGLWYLSGQETAAVLPEETPSLVQSGKPAIGKALEKTAKNIPFTNSKSVETPVSSPDENNSVSGEMVTGTSVVVAEPVARPLPSDGATATNPEPNEPVTGKTQTRLPEGRARIFSSAKGAINANSQNTNSEMQVWSSSAKERPKPGNEYYLKTRKRPSGSPAKSLSAGVPASTGTGKRASKTPDILPEEGRLVSLAEPPKQEIVPGAGGPTIPEEMAKTETLPPAPSGAVSGLAEPSDSLLAQEVKPAGFQPDAPAKSSKTDSSAKVKRFSFWAGASVHGIAQQLKWTRRPEEFLGAESRGVQSIRLSPVAGFHLTGNLTCLPWLSVRLEAVLLAWAETVEYRTEAGQSAERQYNPDGQDPSRLLVQPRHSPRREIRTYWNTRLGLLPEIDLSPVNGRYGLRLGNQFQYLPGSSPENGFPLWNPGIGIYRKNNKWDGEIRVQLYRQEDKSLRVLPESRAEIRQLLWGFVLRRRL